MNAIDTNIWLYLHDRRDPVKQQASQNLIEKLDTIALPWQVGCEFLAAARKLSPFGFTQENAWAAFNEMRALADRIILPAPEDWTTAQDLTLNHSVGIWDALLVASCSRAGVKVLYSEDSFGMNHFDDLAFKNPFK